MLPEYAQVLIRVGVIFVVAVVLTLITTRLVQRFQVRLDAQEPAPADPLAPGAERRRRSRTLASVLRGTLVVVIWTVAVISALGQAGVQVGPILAAAGIVGVALGFGAQSLVKDVLAGFFVLLENHYDVGDVIDIANVSGTVEAVNLRATTLRGLDGARHVVPNGQIAVSTNHTKVYSRYVLVLPVPYEQDVDRAVAVLQRAASDLREDPEYGRAMTAPITVLGVDAYGESSVDVTSYLETVPGEQWRVGRELRRRLKLALDAEGIAIPYPHREIVLRRADEDDLPRPAGDPVA